MPSKKKSPTSPAAAEPEKTQGLSAGLRLFVIALLTAVLLIPALLLRFLVDDRKYRKNQVVSEIAEQWSGGGQVITAPILTLPYREYFKDEKGQLQTMIRYAHFLPEDLAFSGRMTPEVRYRGIYRVVLYQARLQVSGRFAFPDIRKLNLAPENVIWEDAFLTLGLQNTKGLLDKVQIQWNDTVVAAAPGLKSKDVVESGVHAPVRLSPGVLLYAFRFELNHNGHDFLEFLPLGRETRVHLESEWGDPSFIGAFLPDQRDIQPARFSADWKVIDLNRNFPQQWTNGDQAVMPAAFGVSLFTPVDLYHKTARTIKYAIMFIGLTFLALFMLDVLGAGSRRPLHFVQYLLIGIALVMFYTLLLSLSEHLGFGRAYLIASAAVIGLILLYTKSLLANLRQTGLMALILGLLYAYLYIVLQLEDYALLIGSVSLFAVLALMMFLTRKVDWSSLGKAQITAGKTNHG